LRFDLDRNGLVLCRICGFHTTAFIANWGENTVSKINLGFRREVGRYLVGWNPSAAAVDMHDNGYIVMTGEPVEAVAKVAGNRSSCVDRNQDGHIETSTGSDVLARGTDECVLWTSDAAAGSCPRTVVLDSLERIWVGGWCTRQFSVLDVRDGSLIATVPVAASAYDVAISRDGVLWYSGRSHSVIQSIDTETFEVGPAIRSSCGGDLEGIVVDREGRVWIVCAHQPCRAARYDPRDGSWLNICDIPYPRTAHDVTIDSYRNIWISTHDAWTRYSGSSFAYEYNADTGERRRELAIPGCDGANGIGSGFEGNIWFGCHGSWNASDLYPDTGHVTNVRVGAYPSTYSDFTGFLWNAVTGSPGWYSRLYDATLACQNDERVIWSQLYFDVEIPDETRILFKGRTADRTSRLSAAREVLFGTVPGDREPLDIGAALAEEGVPNGQRYFQVEVVLQSLDGRHSPVLRSMDMVFHCECACDEDRSCSAGCDCDDDC
jgi:hypothetical protein